MTQPNRNKVVYYLGAGASCQALPILDQFRKEMTEVVKNLNAIFQNTINPSPGLLKLEFEKKSLIEDFNWAIKESENHQTVDTLAKKFYLFESRGESDLRRLKKVIVAFFHLRQFFNIFSESFERQINLDMRYDSLISSIAKKGQSGIVLNPLYNIITWNYDIQIELAIKQFNPYKSINLIKSDYSIHPVKSQLDSNRFIFDSNVFSVLKLNGNALWDDTIGISNEPLITPVDTLLKSEDKYESLITILNSYGNSGDDHVYFSYSWEMEEDSHILGFQSRKNVIESAAELVSRAKALIVVGYSFPIFNEEIDRRVLSSFQGEHVIIQDVNPEYIQSRMERINSIFISDIAQKSKVKISYDRVDRNVPPKYFPFI